MDMYATLWSPTETAFAASDSSSLTTSARALGHASKYLEIRACQTLQPTSLKTSWQSLQFLRPDTMAPESTFYTRKLRIHPNKQQVVLFNKCLGASRFFYNAANSFLKENGVKGFLRLEALRGRVMSSDDVVTPDMAWQKEVPYDTRQEAIADCITAYKSALSNLRNGNIAAFDVGYRKKHGSTSQTFRVNKKALDGRTLEIFKRRLGKSSRLRMSRRDRRKFFNLQDGSGEVGANFIILKTRPGMWYICLPRVRRAPPDPPVFATPAYRSVFLDPGVRTFQTWYSPDGVCGKVGGCLRDELRALAERHDLLCSSVSKAAELRLSRRGKRAGWARSPTQSKGGASRTKRNLRARCARIRAKIANKVADIQCHTCNFLCSNFQSIFLPEFQVSEMVAGSPLGSPVTRRMLQLSHGRFRERLKTYGAARGRDVNIITEEYTSKTCGGCGAIHAHLGAATVFKCPKCELVVDRDLGAARNMCVKVLSECIT